MQKCRYPIEMYCFLGCLKRAGPYPKPWKHQQYSLHTPVITDCEIFLHIFIKILPYSYHLPLWSRSTVGLTSIIFFFIQFHRLTGVGPYRFTTNSLVDPFLNKAIISSRWGSSFGFPGPLSRPNSLPFALVASNPSFVLFDEFIKSWNKMWSRLHYWVLTSPDHHIEYIQGLYNFGG